MHFVDFGNTEVISLRTIVFLSHEILSLVPFAQLYCLDGVAVTNSELNDQVHCTEQNVEFCDNYI